ncbi:MAG: TDP-N-acetylfucosamine:lipid II N-acetylfucosaminyltransferase [Bacteroidales bacterium]|nr:TDP-N-acetylfucosamine:lipid II N-acetylfucosaminyltransferase [Bacteroidales bacterium]
MNIHLFASENLYSFKYLKFISDNFNLEDHTFIFRKRSSVPFEYDDEIRKKIFFPHNNIYFFVSHYRLLNRAEKILLHQLPHGPALILWNLFPCLLKKITWSIWGGDVYYYRRANESITARFYEIFRRRIIPRIPVIVSFAHGDFETVREVYGTNARYLPCMYPLPVDFLSFKTESKKEEGIYTILAGNSGNPSNNHTEILRKLAPLKESNIRIICPLSYSGNEGYINEVVSLGRETFGDRFVPMREIIEPGRYLEFLFSCDAAIMNHDRQQGLGNILPLLYFGKKVFLRTGTSSYTYLESLGCTLYDISSVDKFDESLFSHDPGLEKNRKIIEELMSEERYREVWENIFNTI